MNIIEVNKWVAHKDGRKGQVVEINAYRARVKWYYDTLGGSLGTGNSLQSMNIKRTWCQFKDLTIIEIPADFKIPQL